jgi:hypothetical protein
MQKLGPEPIQYALLSAVRPLCNELPSRQLAQEISPGMSYADESPHAQRCNS